MDLPMRFALKAMRLSIFTTLIHYCLNDFRYLSCASVFLFMLISHSFQAIAQEQLIISIKRLWMLSHWVPCDGFKKADCSMEIASSKFRWFPPVHVRLQIWIWLEKLIDSCSSYLAFISKIILKNDRLILWSNISETLK